ncbi:MAG: Arginyl-tRNA synthetase [Ktedonobacterales bacterium]|jgi:arginyl-tRNA synthetase|nr:MAG: Arginyl-tRNA synthetase [Ktedonobacterales bacterium]
MLRDTIFDIVARSVAALRENGDLPDVALPAFEIERPQIASHGDYATNVAMKLASAAKAAGEKSNPRAIAEIIATRIRETVAVVPAYDLVETVEVAGPGFINLRLRPAWLLAQTGRVIDEGNSFGSVHVGRGKKINLEFVSANPTGPVTVGNGRGAFIGDTLAAVMRAAGYDVTKEYYFNDAGGQIDKLGRSMEYYLRLALGEADPSKPDEGYFGPYYETVAERMIASGAKKLLKLPEQKRASAIGEATAAAIMDDIRQTMAKMRVEFDVFFNQASLGPSGELQASIDELRAAGYIEEYEGAQWAKTNLFGDDKDREGNERGRVIVRSNGEPTYFASDVAYMRNKFLRGFDRLIMILGPDHHGYIGRLKAVAQMLGHAADDMHILIYQNVTIKGQRMGKRLGNIITLDEIYEEVGPDVTRFFYLMRSSDTHLDFDLDLARKQTDENPGLSVQYAHARASGVFRKAHEQGITESDYATADVTALAGDPPEQLDRELAMIRQLLRLEEVVERAALLLEPHHLTRYGMDLADAFHQFYDHCPILKQGADIPLDVRNARLRLLRAAQAGLARTLTLLGMTAPDRMERAETVERVEA